MKKIISVMVSMVIIITTLTIVPVFADDSEPDIDCSISETELNKGDTVDIIVSISGYEPIKTGAVAFEFNQEILEVVSGEWLISEPLLSDFDKEKLNAVFMYSSAREINGDIFRLTLRAKENILCGGILDIIVEPQLRNENNENIETETNVKVPIVVFCIEHQCGDLIPEIPATCQAEGIKAYYECTICHKLFDANMIETTKDKLVIPFADHNYDNGACSVCGEIDPSYKLGDVNMDKNITVTDATLIQLYLVKIHIKDNFSKALADVNNDSFISIHDATLIQIMIAKGNA